MSTKMKNIESSGASMLALIEALGNDKVVAERIYERNGIAEVEIDQWYPLENNISAYADLEVELGNTTLYTAGTKIPEKAAFPPHINTIELALSSIDIAYHMNHKLNGEIMFNPESGKMLEGIGHYAYKKLSENEAEIICDTPYPTAFDEGIIFAMAQRFNKASFVSLTNGHTSRVKGGNADVFNVTWY